MFLTFTNNNLLHVYAEIQERSVIMCNIRTDTGDRDRKSQVHFSHYTFIPKVPMPCAAQRRSHKIAKSGIKKKKED